MTAAGSGIDTLGFAFAVRSDWQLDGGSVQISGYGTPEEVRTVRHMLPGGGFVALGRGDKAWCEASLPKRADPAARENVQPVLLEKALELAHGAYQECMAFCNPDERRDGHVFELSKLVRLDPVRDFDGVTHAGVIMDGLAGLSRGKVVKVRRWRDPERGQAESIRVGPKAWGATLYDKHAEYVGRGGNADSPGAAPPGRVRFEGRLHADQLRSEWARKNGGHAAQLADLDEFKLRRLRRALFDRAAYDRRVATGDAVAATIAGSGLSPRHQRGLWVWLTCGELRRGMDPKTERLHRHQAAALGLVPFDAYALAGVESVGLDYDTGTQVIVRAS